MEPSDLMEPIGRLGPVLAGSHAVSSPVRDMRAGCGHGTDIGDNDCIIAFDFNVMCEL
jgi:hypothetical protein